MPTTVSTIPAYSYKAENLCPSCTHAVVMQQFPTSPAAIDMTTEELLDQVAAYLGIDRDDEFTFDTDTFPKVVTEQMLEQARDEETCGRCWAVLNPDEDTVVTGDGCPACGERPDYCQGHGITGDPVGWATLNRHEDGLHSWCHENAECQS